MITLLTGAPGAGKSAALVEMLKEWADKGRPIYVDGIPDLTVTHQPLEARKWTTDVPDGSLVVIDEVQRVWRPAGAGSRVPDDIAALETHRHKGLDFLIVTQHPKLVHSNVRNLVGRHIHLRDVGLMGRWWYEWPEAADPGTWRSAPLKKRYRLPKKVFGLYKSASEHIKPVRSFPKVVLVLLAAVVGLGFLGWKVSATIAEKTIQAPPAGSVITDGTTEPVGGVLGGFSRPAAPVTAHGIVEAFTPRIKARPETAPAYDHLRIVVSMPMVVGGYCQGERCRCQTQQGTEADIPDADCRAWVRSAPFNPYRSAVAPSVPAPAAPSVPASAPGL